MNIHDLYLRAPYPLKTAALNIYGYYLHWWRYSARTERLIEEALARELWTPDQWNKWKEERLQYILHRAAAKVPYYKKYWSDRRKAGDNSSLEDLKNWPILKKQTVRDNPAAFVADDRNTRFMFCDRTSGTTGTPISVWISRKTMQNWYALFEARTRRRFGVSIKDRWAMLGGKVIVDSRKNDPPFWIFNNGLNQLYMSVFHIKEKNCIHYVKALEEHKISHIVGYPSSLYYLARGIKHLGIKAPGLKVAITNAEALMPVWRQTISEVFRCPVQSTYGLAELSAGASECQHGSMHIWPEAGIVETLDRPDKNIYEEKMVITGLFNDDMPFIRYDCGDIIKGPVGSDCNCGRGLPVLQDIIGRSDDVVTTPDGRYIFWANNIFSGVNIDCSQLVQESMASLRLLIVPSIDYSQNDENILIDKLRQRFGNLKIGITAVKELPREKNGKIKGFVSLLK